MHANRFLIPLLRARVTDCGAELTGFLGCATVFGNHICTCAHVIEGIDLNKELVVTKWDPEKDEAPFVTVLTASVHPVFDFAVLHTQTPPPYERLRVRPVFDMAVPAYSIGFHDDGISHVPGGRKMFQIAPRAFLGNIVRVHAQPSNKSNLTCELSFPTLSGFSGAPVLSADLSEIYGIVYGNVEQSIQVHSKYELAEGQMKFSETVNRIMELGLFHASQSVLSYLEDLKLQP